MGCVCALHAIWILFCLVIADVLVLNNTHASRKTGILVCMHYKIEHRIVQARSKYAVLSLSCSTPNLDNLGEMGSARRHDNPTSHTHSLSRRPLSHEVRFLKLPWAPKPKGTEIQANGYISNRQQPPH